MASPPPRLPLLAPRPSQPANPPPPNGGDEGGDGGSHLCRALPPRPLQSRLFLLFLSLPALRPPASPLRPPVSMRFSAAPAKRHGCVVAASAAGSTQYSGWENENPYEILGIGPLDGFDQEKMAYKRRQKDAEHSSDAEYLSKLERAYDTVMMEQLQNRKKGVAYGPIQVSKDIKYADNQPIVPWGSRYSRSTAKDLRINMAMSSIFIICISTMGHTDWEPLQFLCFAYFYRIVEKLKTTEPARTPVYNEYGEVEGWGIHIAKQVLRSLGLVLGLIVAASLGYTGLANFSQFLGHYIPSVVITSRS